MPEQTREADQAEVTVATYQTQAEIVVVAIAAVADRIEWGTENDITRVRNFISDSQVGHGISDGVTLRLAGKR